MSLSPSTFPSAEVVLIFSTSRLAMKTDRKDFLYYMLHDKSVPRPSDGEIASHFQAMMLAGSITTATFLPGTLYYLCREPAKRARLIKEIRDNFPTAADINDRALVEKCSYLNAVCEESLRIYPPAGAAHLTRIVPEGGCDIAGYWVPGGVSVFPDHALLFYHLCSFPVSTIDPSVSSPMVRPP